MRLYTTVKPSVRRRHLLRGTALAGIGMLFLVIAGVFFPPSILQSWGLFILIAGGLLIGLGLLPSRRLARLAANPDALDVTDEGNIEFIADKQVLFSFPLDTVDKVSYQEDTVCYGMLIHIKQGLQVRTFLSPKDAEAYRRNGNGLFFPFFSEKSCEALQEFIKGKD